jgi:hypothetical protein
MIGLRGRDQLRINVHTDDLVAAGVEFTADPSRAASRVEQTGAARHHRIHQARLTGQIDTVGRHLTKPVDIPGRVSGVMVGEPTRPRTHATHVNATRHAADQRARSNGESRRTSRSGARVGQRTDGPAARKRRPLHPTNRGRRQGLRHGSVCWLCSIRCGLPLLGTRSRARSAMPRSPMRRLIGGWPRTRCSSRTCSPSRRGCSLGLRDRLSGSSLRGAWPWHRSWTGSRGTVAPSCPPRIGSASPSTNSPSASDQLAPDLRHTTRLAPMT